MVSKCFGLCENEKPATGMRFYDSMTGIHWKKCSICDKRINTTEVRCYCCKLPLRTGPNRLKYKIENREIKRI